MRADYRCISSADGERYVCEQQLAGTPFERVLRSSRDRDRPEPGGPGTEVDARPTARRLRGLSRFGSPMMRRGPGKILDEALDGLEQALGGAEERRVSGCPRTDSKWWGWGANEKPARARPRPARAAARGLGADPSASREVPPIEAVLLPEPRAAAGCRASTRSGEGLLDATTSSACATRPEELPRPRPAALGQLEHAPDAIVVPADPAQLEARARRLRGRGRRRGAVRRRHSVVGGVEPRAAAATR